MPSTAGYVCLFLLCITRPVEAIDLNELQDGAFVLTAEPTAEPLPNADGTTAEDPEQRAIQLTGMPTTAPTAPLCADGTHGCDTETTICVSVLAFSETTNTVESSLLISCECLDGFFPDPSDTSHCLADQQP